MWFYKAGQIIDAQIQQEMMEKLVAEIKQRINPAPKKVLLLPPDITRYHCGAANCQPLPIVISKAGGVWDEELEVNEKKSLHGYVEFLFRAQSRTLPSANNLGVERSG